ncbi:LLM class flavin-dependent oxidoreductase [Allostreptomyces psammosilenae]|uniref:Alkanesulfonate monooxygenase SsuD/methylene tetrahydromethanopterin reductase-like flavin-dependent oxidoreductase (Luciferase family) n=1 Tax=Allostreptomyces psammosilenae TaxID=1892865 RepID=A0A852ZXL4_9ACTN|nr:LLM class flavin-dependent oxidoreductase [Allostreptomyces psammosilenae]NYI05464.1 alkanesulfonate monooxygenase SsuD/methylene tetrahydromethanopterin reductase-like flavin-dependent oxidoreductase (luciferase family) [Allostreptomyces psammosilenae]
MRLSTVILPIHRRPELVDVWRRAEDLGVHTAYTYDHLSWRSFRDEPWFATIPTLTAAAMVTDRIRLGTMVISPNFRHPVTLAKDLLSLDDLSEGRLTIGIGAGGTGFDATTLGQEPWTPRERADRFAEFVALLDRLLREPVTTRTGRYYTAHEARMHPGCMQRPRPPFAIAATGPRGLALAAAHGQAWVTFGDPWRREDADLAGRLDAVAAQAARLDAACADAGRDPATIRRVLLTGVGTPAPLHDPGAFRDFTARAAAIGVDEIVVHWPVPDSVFAVDEAAFIRSVTAAIDATATGATATGATGATGHDTAGTERP